MLAGISPLRVWPRDGTECLEGQTEVGKGQDPHFPALCHLLSPGETEAGSQVPLTLVCYEKSRRSSQKTGILSGSIWGQGPTALMG